MLLPTIDADADGLKYVPMAKTRLKVLEEQRKASGLPFIHRRVFSDGTTTVDVTASEFAPKIRVRTSGGAVVVAQYSGTGTDGLVYQTLVGFALSGQRLWQYDAPASDKTRVWLLGISESGRRVAFLRAEETTLEFCTLVDGVLQTSIGTFAVPYRNHSSQSPYTQYQLSTDATRVVLSWVRTVGLSVVPVALLCGVDLSPSYTELDTISPTGNAPSIYPVAGSHDLGVVFSGRAAADYVFGVDLELRRADVVSSGTSLVVSKSDVVVESYDPTYVGFGYGGFAVSSEGNVAVGYGRLAPFDPPSGGGLFSSAVVNLDGVVVRSTLSARGEELPVDPPYISSFPLACSSQNVLFRETIYYNQSTDYLGTSLLPGAMFLGSRSAEFALFIDSASNLAKISRPEGNFLLSDFIGPGSSLITVPPQFQARRPFHSYVTEDGVVYSYYLSPVASESYAFRKWTPVLAEDGVTVISYSSPTEVAPRIPRQITRTVGAESVALRLADYPGSYFPGGVDATFLRAVV